MSDEPIHEKTKHIGRSYIGSKLIFRMVKGPKDHRPLCLCKHESEEEALACEEANKRHIAGTTAIV